MVPHALFGHTVHGRRRSPSVSARVHASRPTGCRRVLYRPATDPRGSARPYITISGAATTPILLIATTTAARSEPNTRRCAAARRTRPPAAGRAATPSSSGQRPLRLRQLDACSLPRVRRPGGKDVGRHPRDGQLPDDHGRPLVWLERHHSSAERRDRAWRMRLESTTSLTR